MHLFAFIERNTYRHNLLAGIFLCAACTFITGCEKSAPSGDDVLDESWFSLDDKESPAANAPADLAVSKASLSIKLAPGTKIPLQKVVEKSLIQTTIQGPLESSERIELFMSVSVEEIRDQNKKFRINYNRVKYEADLNGQKTTYDSTQPTYPVPDQAIAYQGMVNNGFSFWVGPDNKITDVVDFHPFLQRCLANVPQHKAEIVSQIVSNYSGQEGIANFVDDTIGLLPYDPNSVNGNQVVRLGGQWTKSRNYNDPVPMTVNNHYTLNELTDDYAKIQMIGEIIPAAAVAPADRAMSLQIQDGHAIGSCTIDRKTGLPLESRVDHQFSMVVQLDGNQFEQQKRVITSVRMFPEQSDEQNPIMTVGGEQSATPQVRPAGYQQGSSEY